MNAVSFASLAEKWPSSFVARNEVGRFSGGILHPRTLANQDCLGSGPSGAVRVGRRVAYPVAELVKWMESRAVAAGKAV
jgi:hypothetical protein